MPRRYMARAGLILLVHAVSAISDPSGRPIIRRRPRGFVAVRSIPNPLPYLVFVIALVPRGFRGMAVPAMTDMDLFLTGSYTGLTPAPRAEPASCRAALT